MKKFTIIAILAIAATAFVGCGNSTPKADLKSENDSLSYAMGVANSNGLRDYLINRMGIDTAYIDQFVKGLNDGVNCTDDAKKSAYYAGLQIGQQMGKQIEAMNLQFSGGDSTAQIISTKNFMAGFITGATGEKGLMSPEEAMQVAQIKSQEIQSKMVAQKFEGNKKKGTDFLAANAKKEGVKTLPSGLQYKVLKEGNGVIPADTSLVLVRYEGKLIDGTVFETCLDKEPVKMKANQVIKGWTEALTHMPVGSTWEIYIPQELAYGERQAGKIEPFSTLIFKLELVGIEK